MAARWLIHELIHFSFLPPPPTPLASLPGGAISRDKSEAPLVAQTTAHGTELRTRPVETCPIQVKTCTQPVGSVGRREETGRFAMNPNNEEITFQEKVELAIKYHLETGNQSIKLVNKVVLIKER